MAGKVPASTGYFNKEMLDILKKGEKAEKKTTTKKPTSTKKGGTKKK